MSQRSEIVAKPGVSYVLIGLIAALLLIGPVFVWAGGKGGGKKPPTDPPPPDPPPPANLPSFEINEIGLGGSWSSANGMNNLGDVVGESARPHGPGALYVHIAGSGAFELNRLIPSSMLESPKDLVWGPDVSGDSAGDLFVASEETNSVVAFDGATGEAIGDIVEPGSGGLLVNPYGLGFRNDDLYVTSRGTNQVLRYLSATGFSEVEVFIESGNGLDDPTSFVWGPDFDGAGAAQDFYLTSRLTDQVLVYDGNNGDFLGSLFLDGIPLNGPINLCIGPGTTLDGALYISGSGSANVVRYDFDSATGSDEFINGNGLTTPQGLAFDASGDLYVANGEGGNVLRFDAEGNFISEFVVTGDGGLDNAVGVLFDGDNLLVTSRDTDQVLVYEGPTGANPGGFLDPFVPGVGWRLFSAEDINDAGQIVGYGYPRAAFGEYVSSAYRYTPPEAGERFGRVENLGVPGPSSAQARAINNQGDVIGQFTPGNDSLWHAFLWMDGDSNGYQDLGALEEWARQPRAVSDRVGGHVKVVGGGGDRAWRYDTSNGGEMEDLGTLKNDNSGRAFAMDINVDGNVVGWAAADYSKKRDIEIAFHTVGDRMESLGSNSRAEAINSSGDVVGLSSFVSDVVPFLYSDEFGMVNLSELVPTMPIGLPGDINDFGQICGPRVENWYRYDSRAYILTPK